MKEQKHKKTKRRKQKKGGSLCNPPYDINKPENDIYTMDTDMLVFPTKFLS